MGFNYAGRIQGAQISLINFAPEVRGTQIGLINLAGEVKGLQLGLVNLALDVEGASVGLLNGVLRGYNHIGVYSSDLAPVNLSLQFGSKYVYTVINAGFSPVELNSTGGQSLLSLGLGGHVPVSDDFFVDFDVSGGNIFDGLSVVRSKEQILGVGRVMVGYQVQPLLGVYGGVSLNTLTSVGDPVEGIGLFGGGLRGGDGVFAMWPGAFVGVRL